MIAVGMMEMPGDQVVDVVAVGDCLVAAARAMDVSRLVLAAVVPWGTSIGVALADWNRMLCYRSVAFLVAQMAVVQVIDVPVVLDLDMPAMGTVLVIVCLLGHDVSFRSREVPDNRGNSMAVVDSGNAPPIRVNDELPVAEPNFLA
jgi:hypothetical protein